MADEKQLKLLKQGVEGWNQWREENSEVAVDLSGARLNWADLSGTNLSRTNLSEAFLSRADLSQANLSEANLNGAHLGGAHLKETNLNRVDLSGANLSRVDLSGANLSRADLSRAHLNEAYLKEADLSGTNLNRTSMFHTILGNVDLSEVQGLETVKHYGPSYIDSHTLYRSKGKIPEVFLRGCGLSDLQIQMALLHNPDLTSEQVTDITYKIHEIRVGKSIQYYSCFISYNHKNEPFARRLHDDLQNSGVRCWFAPHSLKIGDKIRSTIDQSIRLHDKLLLILSEHSVNSSWVEMEVETALEEERRRNQVILFPVRLDEAVMQSAKAWAAEIRRRHIGDFCRCENNGVYEKAFGRLLRDLKAAEN